MNWNTVPAPEAPRTPQPTVRTVEDTADYLAEIVGEESRAGERIQAGPNLKLMYETAVAVAYRHGGHRPVLLRLDRLDLVRMVCHMDLVRMEGRVIEAGRSSVVVEVRCFVKHPTERDFTPAHVGFFTMVAVTESGKPVRRLPLLSYESPMGVEAKTLAAHRRAQLAEREQALDWISREKNLRVEDVLEPRPTPRYEYLAPAQTEVRVKGQIAVAGLNQDRRVRAGDLLVWLDRIATYTARNFTGNENIVTISVNDLTFKKALHATDRIEVAARVVYVRTHTLELSLDITVHTLEGAQYALDPVNFFLLNFHPSGMKKRITTGLKLEDSDQESLRDYLMARTRFAFWRSHPESHLTQAPE